MKRLFKLYGRYVGHQPLVALGSVLALTILAVLGLAMTEDQAEETEAFLPDGSDLIAAQGSLARSFPDSSGLETVQVVFRGDVHFHIDRFHDVQSFGGRQVLGCGVPL